MTLKVICADSSRAIRLSEHRAFGGSDALSILASVPYFLLGVAATAAAWVQERIPFVRGLFEGRRRSYRTVPIDEDAEILNAYDED